MIFIILSALLTLPASADTVVDVVDPAILQKLDQPGVYSLSTVLGGAADEMQFLEATKNDTAMTRLRIMRLSGLTEAKNSRYLSLVNQITRDVEEIKAASGEKMAYSSEQAEKLAPAGNVARHFDPYWLSSSRAAFPLIAVVNRVDRKDFAGECGELRFIYRLAYYKAEKKGDTLLESRSTLPLFLNVVYTYGKDENGSCQGVAKRWQSPKKFGTKEEEAAWLLAGPLAKSAAKLHQIELNMQIVRFPSGQKVDFGGQAIYLFRIFRESGDALVSVPLENTPDVAAIAESKSLRDSLLRQIAGNLDKIDNGTFVLDNTDGQLLATRALSFSTSGRARLGNKPFTALFGPDAKELSSLSLANLKYVKSARGLVERLNNQTCIGCHQSSGTAGFHFLGLTGSLNSAFNQVVLPFSPHYYAERVRREAYVGKLAEGGAPDTFRPHSISPAFGVAGVRDLCLPNGNDLAAIACEAGSVCKLNVSNKMAGVAIGECVATPNVTSGHVCRSGVISTAAFKKEHGSLYNLNSFRDAIDISRVITDGGIACGNPSGGVPLGRISRACDSNTKEGRLEFVDGLAEGKAPPKEMCAMRGGPQFDECAKSANPPDCLAKAKIARGLLDTCYVGKFCREDYICQQLPTDVSRLYAGSEKKLVEGRIRKLGELGIGFCVPNYFVFNMRTDGHIIPEGRQAR